MLLSSGFLGLILFVTGGTTFTTSAEEPSESSEGATLVWPDDAQLDTRPGHPTHAVDPSAPSPQEATPSITPATSQTSEPQEPLLNNPVAPSAASPSDYPEQHSWGQLLRSAPLHSGPSVSSAILGHAAAGTKMQLLERNLGWTRIRDPGTSREGWVYEDHITPVERPSATGAHEAALTSETDEVSKPTTRSFKSKKPRKVYKTKKSAKTHASQKGTSAARRAYSKCKQWNEGMCVY